VSIGQITLNITKHSLTQQLIAFFYYGSRVGVDGRGEIKN